MQEQQWIDEWDAVALAHDVAVADDRNYVYGNHPRLPQFVGQVWAPSEHLERGCPCIAGRYSRDEYVALRQRGGSPSSQRPGCPHI